MGDPSVLNIDVQNPQEPSNFIQLHHFLPTLPFSVWHAYFILS